MVHTQEILIEKELSAVTSRNGFDHVYVIGKVKHYLPTQASLKDFIHHNTLHAFQHLKFYDAIFSASKAFGYQVTLPLKEYRSLYNIGRIREDVLNNTIIQRKGIENLEEWKTKLLNKKHDDINTPRIGALRASWKNKYKIDLDDLVHPLLFRVLCSYLDQGIATWSFPDTGNGFLAAIIALEKTSFTSFFKTIRAKKLLTDSNIQINDLLKLVVSNESYYEQYLFDQQFSHRGWSGMVSTIEDHPDILLETKIISLHDLIVFELLLEIDALDYTLGNSWQPLSFNTGTPPLNLFTPEPPTELREVFMLWQDAFEWSYYDTALAGLASGKKNNEPTTSQYSFQALFCIDERECSLRRHIEMNDHYIWITRFFWRRVLLPSRKR
jgi:uncharacterized protein YbcC (UPF0753/DUF2309 family)